jgi:hypothetical protein
LPGRGAHLAWFLFCSPSNNPGHCRSHQCRATCDLHQLRNGICCGCRERRSSQRSSLESLCSSHDPTPLRLPHGQTRRQQRRGRPLMFQFWSRRLSRRSKRPRSRDCLKGSGCTDGLIAAWRAPLLDLGGSGNSPRPQAGHWPAGSDVCSSEAAATGSGHFPRSSNPHVAAQLTFRSTGSQDPPLPPVLFPARFKRPIPGQSNPPALAPPRVRTVHSRDFRLGGPFLCLSLICGPWRSSSCWRRLSASR